MARKRRGAIEITDDCEFESYIRSLTASSDRVRYVLVAALILTALLFVGYRNSSYQSWMSSRLELAYLVRAFELWKPEPREDRRPSIREYARHQDLGVSATELVSLTAKVEMAEGWARGRGFRSEEEILAWIRDLHQAEIQHVLQPTVPFLGLRFDINDLGVFGGLGLTLLMLLLTFSMSREHENVYLALWKVRRVHEAEGGREKQRGRANLLYHALAMAQVLSKPPTLARWHPHWSRVSTKVLFVLPLVVHALVVMQDLRTTEYALILNPSRTEFNLAIEILAVVLLLVFSFLCIAYSRSNDVRWSETFFIINSSRRNEEQPGWSRWVRWVQRRKGEETSEGRNGARGARTGSAGSICSGGKGSQP